MVNILVCLLLFIHSRASSFYLNNTISTLKNVSCLVITNNNKLIIAATRSSNTSYLQSAQWKSTYPAHEYASKDSIDLGNFTVNFLLLSKDNSILLVGLLGKGIRFFILDSDNKLIQKLTLNTWVQGHSRIDLSLDDNFLIFQGNDGQIKVYENTSIQSTQPSILPNQTSQITIDYFGGSGSVLSAPSFSPTEQFDIPLNFHLVQTLNSNVKVSSLKICPNSSKMYIAYENSTICAYYAQNYTFNYESNLELNQDIATTIQFSESGKTMVTGSKKGLVRVYATDQKGIGLSLIQILYEPGSQIDKLTMTSNNLRMLVTTEEGSIFVYSRIDQDHDFFISDNTSLRRRVGSQTPGSTPTTFRLNSQVTTTSTTALAISGATILPIRQDDSNRDTKIVISHSNDNNMSPAPTTKQLPTDANTLTNSTSVSEATNDTTKDKVVGITGISHPAPILLSNSTALDSTPIATATSPTVESSFSLNVLSSDDSLLLVFQPPSSTRIYASCSSILPMCQECTDRSTCLSCVPYYYLYLKKCRLCPVGCLLCKDNRICFQCAPKNYINITQAKCYPCNKDLPNCIKCEGPNQCTRCAQGFLLHNGFCMSLQRGTTTPNLIVELTPRDPSKSGVVTQRVQQKEEGGLLLVFVITCVVFGVLLLITGTLLFYVNRMMRTRSDNLGEEVQPRPIRVSFQPSSQRRLVSQSMV